MNVEQFIYAIQKRPGMYVGCMELEPIVHFINGFMLNNFISKRVDIVEKKFKEEFHDWVREQLEKRYNIELEEHHDYLFYITEVSQNSEEELNIFFELCNEFFREFYKKEND